MIKLLAVDLDDTLLGEDLTISEKNKLALRQAEEQGVSVLLASGRPFLAMERFAQELGMFQRPGFLISDNGSTTYSTKPCQVILSHVLDPSLLDDLFAQIDLLGLPIQVYKEKTIYVNKKSQFTLKDMELSGYTSVFDPDLRFNLDFLPQKLVIPGDPAVLPFALKTLKQSFHEKVNVMISKPYFLEVLPPLADKGLSLRYVAETLGIERQHVMAIGDSYNDLGMIEYAGWGVAVANAVSEVKQSAKITTIGCHEQDGVAEVIASHILR